MCECAGGPGAVSAHECEGGRVCVYEDVWLQGAWSSESSAPGFHPDLATSGAASLVSQASVSLPRGEVAEHLY